jgi:uncharacterized membrane protein YkvA (DUF1232 family)
MYPPPSPHGGLEAFVWQASKPWEKIVRRKLRAPSSPPLAVWDLFLQLILMAEISYFAQRGASRVTPRIMNNLLHRLPLLKAEFTQIHAPKFPHLVDQLEFLADVVEDFAEGAYQDMPYTAAAASAFAIIYTHRLLDIIPDFVAQISFEDDSAVVRAVLAIYEKDFEKYAHSQHLNWKKITLKP